MSAQLFRLWATYETRSDQVLTYLRMRGGTIESSSPKSITDELMVCTDLSRGRTLELVRRMEYDGLIRRSQLSRIEVLP